MKSVHGALHREFRCIQNARRAVHDPIEIESRRVICSNPSVAFLQSRAKRGQSRTDGVDIIHAAVLTVLTLNRA